MGYIYLVTNLVNGKRYVGQSTCDDIKKRWDTHHRMRKKCLGSAIYRAYQKYGIDKFKYQIICICFDEDCNRFEEEYIRKYNTITPNGYNMKLLGGSYKVSEETRALLSKKAKAWWSDETNRKAFINPCKGKQLSDEHKQKLRDAQNTYWNTMSDELRQKRLSHVGTKGTGIRKYKSEESKQRSLDAIEASRIRKGVAQYTPENVFVKEYKSISEATNITGICRSTISKVCLNKPNYHTAGGFLWKFVEVNENSS
jgi:group I intron endonuclease